MGSNRMPIIYECLDVWLTSTSQMINETSRGYKSEEEKRLIQVENITKMEVAEAEETESRRRVEQS